MLIQILVTIFALTALGSVVRRFKRGSLSRTGVAAWLLMWVAAIVAVWNPWITNRVAGFLGVGRGADAVLYVSIVVLFYTVFRLYGKSENLEHQLSELVKRIALKDWEKPK